jgi:hypothetical protein
MMPMSIFVGLILTVPIGTKTTCRDWRSDELKQLSRVIGQYRLAWYVYDGRSVFVVRMGAAMQSLQVYTIGESNGFMPGWLATPQFSLDCAEKWMVRGHMPNMQMTPGTGASYEEDES